MRPIDADMLLEKVRFRVPVVRLQEKIIADCVEIMRNLIGEAPTLDVVPVVRCKDCVHAYDTDDIAWCFKRCELLGGEVLGQNCFCDAGKRRDNATD